MLTLSKIERLADAGEYSALLRAVTENGRQVPLPVRLRLEDEPSRQVAALGLALQRATELALRPSPVVVSLADRLSELLADPNMPPASPGAVAAAMGGLLAFRNHVSTTGQLVEPIIRSRVENALRQGAYRLFEAQSASGGLIGDTIDAAILLWHLSEPLGLREAIQTCVRLDEFDRACRREGVWKDATVQAVMKLAGGAKRHMPAPARAA